MDWSKFSAQELTLMYPHVIDPLIFREVKESGGYKRNEVLVFTANTSSKADKKVNVRLAKNRIINPGFEIRRREYAPAGQNRGLIDPPLPEATEVMPSSMKRSRAIDDGAELPEHTSRLGVANDRGILNSKAR
jgi:hypothetical protein